MSQNNSAKNIINSNFELFLNKTMIEINQVVFSLHEFILLAIFGVLFLVQLFYIVLKATFILSGRKRTHDPDYPPVSVIITSRNYEEELKQIVPALLSQDYPDFQVVVVNDCSSDGTELYLSKLLIEYGNLKVTRILQETDFPNALALTVGIRAASHDWMIFLNPLCIIQGKDWLKSYAGNLLQTKEVVFGYVSFSSCKGSMNSFIHFENFNSFIISGAARYLGLPMPVNEINLAYRRSQFLDRRGFAAVLETPFCENELYTNDSSNRKNSIHIMRKEASVGYSDEAGWIDYVNFKKKQLLLKQKFTFGQRLYLWIDTSSRIVFDLLMIILLILSPWRLWVAGIWLFKNILELIWGIIAMRRLGEKNLFPWIGFYKSLLPLVNSMVFVNQIFIGNKRRWK